MTQEHKWKLEIIIATFKDELWMEIMGMVICSSEEARDITKVAGEKVKSLLQSQREEDIKAVVGLIDDIELQNSRVRTSTLDEWRLYKQIRNNIRDKFLRKEQ